MIVLHDWAVMAGPSNYFEAPELWEPRLVGAVYGHPDPRHPDGKRIQTSRIAAAEGRVVTTQRGTRYRLGRIDPRYRSWLQDHRPRWDWRRPITVVEIVG